MYSQLRRPTRTFNVLRVAPFNFARRGGGGERRGLAIYFFGGGGVGLESVSTLLLAISLLKSIHYFSFGYLCSISFSTIPTQEFLLVTVHHPTKRD